MQCSHISTTSTVLTVSLSGVMNGAGLRNRISNSGTTSTSRYCMVASTMSL